MAPRSPNPRATPVPLLFGDLVSINGQLYQIGPGLLPVSGAPPPPPPPLLTFDGYRDDQRNWITQTTPLAAVILVGKGWGARPGTVTFAGLPALIRSWEASEIGVIVPAMLAPGPVAIQVNGIRDYRPLSILAPPPPPPPRPTGAWPRVDAFVAAGGAALRLLPSNSVITAIGAGFGPQPGELWWAGLALPVLLPPLSWSDTSVTFRTPVEAGRPGAWLMIRSRDGRWGDWRLP